MVAAAWLHDTLEDTATTYGDLVENFGEDVAHLVFELTDLYTPAAFPAWNRAKRKRAEARRLGEASLQAQVIKLADIADNTGDIVVNDPKFASVYLPEKAAILARIGGALDQWLRFRKKQQRAS
jgi:(p)ppGpp synthase/HD superfamily hydrolase